MKPIITTKMPEKAACFPHRAGDDKSDHSRGSDEYHIAKGDRLVAAYRDMPGSSIFGENASPQAPFFVRVSFYSTVKSWRICADLRPCGDIGQTKFMASVLRADAQFMDTFLRLVTFLDVNRPRFWSLAPLTLRELRITAAYYAQGVLRDLAMQGRKTNQIIRSNFWLKTIWTKPCALSDLARHVHMSVSASAQVHFKSITGMSPLQYHKQLRVFMKRSA